MAVKSPPPSFPATLTTSFGPAVTRGPPAEGALTPTSPEPVTAAASKPVQGEEGGQQLSSRHKSLSVSRNPLPVLSPQSASIFAPSPLTSAHPPPEFLWTGIWTAPPSARLPLGPPIRRRENCQTSRQSVNFKLHCTPTNLDPYREALAERFPLRLAVRRDVRHGGGGGGGSDGDGAVGDVLAGRPVYLGVGRLDGRREGFHAVDALGGIGQARLGADARPRAGAPVHVGILRRFGAALSRDGDEGFGRRGPRRDRGRRLLVGGDA